MKLKKKLIEDTFATWLITVLIAISIFFQIGCPLAISAVQDGGKKLWI